MVDQRTHNTTSPLFKEVAGVCLGAVVVSGIFAGIGLYRRSSPKQIMGAAVGGGLISLITFAGNGAAVFDDLLGHTQQTFAERVQRSSPNFNGR